MFVSPFFASRFNSRGVQTCKITISIVGCHNTQGESKCWFKRLSDWLVCGESVSSRQTQDLSLGGPPGSDPP